MKLFLPGMLNCATEVRDNVVFTREMNSRSLEVFCSIILCPVSFKQSESNAGNLQVFYLLSSLN